MRTPTPMATGPGGGDALPLWVENLGPMSLGAPGAGYRKAKTPCTREHHSYPRARVPTGAEPDWPDPRLTVGNATATVA